MTTAPLQNDPAGSVVALVADVSAQRAVERLKDEIISVTGHELRTPLTAIRGSLGLLEAGLGGTARRLRPAPGRNGHPQRRPPDPPGQRHARRRTPRRRPHADGQRAGRPGRGGRRGRRGPGRDRRHRPRDDQRRRRARPDHRRPRPADPGGHQPAAQRGEVLPAESTVSCGCGTTPTTASCRSPFATRGAAWSRPRPSRSSNGSPSWTPAPTARSAGPGWGWRSSGVW